MAKAKSMKTRRARMMAQERVETPMMEKMEPASKEKMERKMGIEKGYGNIPPSMRRGK